MLFWQPKINYYDKLLATKYGTVLLVLSNYLTWIYFAYISFVLIKKDANMFWQLLVATVVSELIEKYLKAKNFWPRPSFQSHKAAKVPRGLIKSWYLNGSFPSGHTMKATFFLLFIVNIIPGFHFSFLLVVLPLLFFRVATGFHYPIDILGGLIIGFFVWATTHNLIFPDILVNLIKNIFIWFKI